MTEGYPSYIIFTVIEELTIKSDSKILLLVLDGVGGLPKDGYTELETAKTPNLDQLAKRSVTGLTYAVAPGITPGSGPAHLSLFGYDPIKYQIGRGVLEALGVDVSLKPNDIAARGNFATIDENGLIIDRRAGRISTEENQVICKKLQSNIINIKDIEIHIIAGKEHRFVLVLRGPGLDDQITETDPQKIETSPLPCKALVNQAAKTADIVNEFVAKAQEFLELPANMVLLRGFAKPPEIPSLQERFKLTAAAIATYPMYRGLAKLVGMSILETGSSIEDEIETIKKYWKDYDFFYIHIKKTDSYSEDGNFEGKVKVIEQVDAVMPEFLALNPDVLVITGDHSTPSLLKAHSWHLNPFLLYSKWIIPDTAKRFTERECMLGYFGRFHAVHAVPRMLANALKLKKFGA